MKVFDMNSWQEKTGYRYEFRYIKEDEWEQAVFIEHSCFPPNEACSKEHMKERVELIPDQFLVVVDKNTGKLAGFLNGLATNEDIFRDEFFLDATLNNPSGVNVMIMGLSVLSEYRLQGIATALVNEYAVRETAKGRKKLILTCLDSKVEMYKKMGFWDCGMSGSAWGGEEWHEMTMTF